MAHSVVQWYPELEKHKCGYCKQLNTNCSYGMWAEVLTVEDYQNLIDRGWRRSGKYCYKSVMDVTCCPLYTIRCEALDFKLSKSQKKIIKRVNKYLSESTQDSLQESSRDNIDNDEAMPSENITDIIERPVTNIDISKIDTSNFTVSPKTSSSNSQDTTSKIDVSLNETGPKVCAFLNSENKNYKPGLGADSSKPPCKKAKLLRIERRQQKLAAKGVNSIQYKTNTNQGKSLEEFIKDDLDNPRHQLKLHLVKTGGSSKYWERVRTQEYPIYRKYQMIVHDDPPEKCSERQFTNFLFESPLQHYYPTDGLSCGYGSFHQQYWLDDKLIAVGVIDILPKCVSSVYFFYDPDYRHLTLGTYGSLREVEFTRQLNRSSAELKYYYMGFYIHSCPKMRYKANLTPSYLLCPETYQWFPIKKCTTLLNIKPYSRFNENLDDVDDNYCQPSDVDTLLILLNYRTCIPYRLLKTKIQGKENEYINFANLVGKKCVSRILLIPRDSDFF